MLSCLVRSDSWDPMNWDPRSPLDSSALLPLEFPGVNTAAGCHVLSRGASQLRGRALLFLESLALQADSFTTASPGKARRTGKS